MTKRLMAAAVAALAGSAAGQTISYTGGSYTQSFDGLTPAGSQVLAGLGPHQLEGVLGSTGMNGWYGTNFGGTSVDTEFRAQDGSLAGSTGRGVLSLGAASSTERALGGLATSNQIARFGALFVNNTGNIMTDVTVSYTGEQWRRGDVAAPNSIFFAYSFGGSITSPLTSHAPLNFVAPNTQAAPVSVGLNGNDPANQGLVSATISGLTWAPGQTLALVWQCQDQTGQDDGLAIDNLSVSAVPAPGSMMLLAVGGLIAARRRR